MTAFTTVQLVEEPRGVATLWLNRAERNNAFDALMIRELTHALDQVQANAGLRLLLIRARGRHFSAGADLEWMRQAAGMNEAANRADAQALAELMHGLAHCPVPTLAVVHGAAFGGALGLIACCDIAIAAEDAQFCLSEVRIGLIPAVISPFVVQAIGVRATRRYALSAERFDGWKARQLGLVAECYAAHALPEQANRWIDNLLQGGPQALRACKQLLLQVGDGQPHAALRDYCENAIARIRSSAEGQEGLSAFLEKRPPAWQSIAAHDKDS